MSPKQKFLAIFIALFVAIGLGILFEHLYKQSDRESLPINLFQSTFAKKEKQADKTMADLQKVVVNKQWDVFHTFEITNHSDISYYIFKGQNLLYWTDNKIDISNLSPTDKDQERFCHLGNAYGVVKTLSVDSFAIVAFIKIKDDYNLTDSKYVKNRFAQGFFMDSQIVVEQQLGKTQADSWPIYAQNGTYLFSLSKNGEVVFRREFAYLGTFFYAAAFILFFVLFYLLDYWFGDKMRQARYFLMAFGVFALITCVCLYFNIPDLLFSSDIFSPIYYASGEYMSSLGHLIIITVAFCTSIATFYFKMTLPFLHAKSSRNSLWMWLMQLLSLLFFGLIFWLFRDLLYNSGFELALYRIENLSIYSIIAFFLIMTWFLAFILFRDKCITLLKYSFNWHQVILSDVMVTLLLIGAAAAVGHLELYKIFIGYFLLCVTVDALRYVTKRALNFWHLLLLVFVYTNFIVWYTYTQIQVIKRDKYALVADNIALGEDSSFEVYVHKLLEEVEVPLSVDETVLELLEQQKLSSQDRMMRYVTKSYFHDYWNNYDIKLFVTDTISEAAHRYDDDLKSGVLEPFTDHFYANRMQRNSYDFVGIFDYTMPDGAVKRLFLVLFKKSGMENYGYQDVLFEPETNRLSLLLSTAQYVNGEKVYSAGRYEYPDVLDAKNYLKDGNITYYNGYAHYIFPYGKDTYIIVGEQHPQKYWAYMLFFTYLFTIYLLVAVFFYIYWFRLNSNMTLKNTFLSQVQQSFITFVVLSLAVVFAISIIFIYGQYKTVQTQEQIDKTNYVRMALEEYWGHKSAHPGVYTADLNFFIQDLSQTYKTDIHVYNANGELLTTSRPYIFSKGLISKLMNPQVFFRSVNKEQVMSEHLGSLTYLTSYTEILNSNKERIGYISVPLFFSSQELSKELFTFLAIFINVYFVFLILAAVVSVLVSRRLSRPIKTIEQKLKAIKLGKRNEKIEYNHNSENDEIGTLINQYNLMVDELSESAQMLAQSERESAWREMARQIAHEIKNPLTPMKLTIQQLQRAKSLDEEAFNNYFEKSARILVEQIDSLSLIATEFSNFARIPVAHLVRVDIAAKLISVVDLFKNNYEEVDIVYLTTLDQVYIMADADQMTQLFNNLLRNAIQAIPSTQKGRVVVELDCDDEFVKISITDNGCGISDEVAGKLFTPNFTTKSSGMGLGLSIVKNIITVSQGEISFTTQVNVGTTFYVKFPLVK